MLIIRAAVGTLLVLGVASCAAPKSPLTSVVDVTGPSGVTGGDVYASYRANGSDYPTIMGSQILEIRTADADGEKPRKEREILGANCVVRGDVFEAKVTTPGGVRLPLYGHRSPELIVTCAHAGYEPLTKTLKPYNFDQATRRKTAMSHGPLAVVLAGALVSAIYEGAVNDVENDRFEYPESVFLMTASAGGSAATLPQADATPPEPNAAAETLSAEWRNPDLTEQATGTPMTMASAEPYAPDTPSPPLADGVETSEPEIASLAAPSVMDALARVPAPRRRP